MKLYIITIILALCMVACARDSKHREMLMLYVQGRLQQEEEDYLASIISMFNAEKAVKKHGISDILGLIYYSLSDTYKFLYNPIEQQNYARLAYNHFILSGDTCHIYLGMEILAEAYYDNRNYEKSASLAQQMVTYEKAVPDPQIKIIQ